MRVFSFCVMMGWLVFLMLIVGRMEEISAGRIFCLPIIARVKLL